VRYFDFFFVLFGATFVAVFFTVAFTGFDPIAFAADFFTFTVADCAAPFTDFLALAATFDAFFTIGLDFPPAMVLAASLTADAILPATLPMLFAAVSKTPTSAFFDETFLFAILESFYGQHFNLAAFIPPFRELSRRDRASARHAQLHHAVREPEWHAATVKWKIHDRRTFHGRSCMRNKSGTQSAVDESIPLG
jgi:hypothetical protein